MPGGISVRQASEINLVQHEANVDRLIPRRPEKPNPHLIQPFFGLQAFSFPSLIGPNLQAILAFNP